jgi:hypothetical protein
MSSEKKLVEIENGVELWKISLKAGGMEADAAYVVKAPKLTPETWSFGTLVEAEAKFKGVLRGK